MLRLISFLGELRMRILKDFSKFLEALISATVGISKHL